MDDLISRQMAIDALIAQANIDGAYGYISARDADIILDSLPSAQKIGEWIEREDPFGFFDTIPVCSECGHTTKMRERYNYCPNCGADMRGDSDGRSD